MFFVKLIVVLGGLGVILKLTSKWWLPLLNKFKTRPDENPLTTLLTWFNEPDKQDRRTAVGVLVVILMGLAMPLSRTVVWSGLGLIIIAGIAFWGIGLFAEEKVKKARQASFNNLLSKLVWMIFVANLTLYSLKAYGIDLRGELATWSSAAITQMTPVDPKRIGPLPEGAHDIAKFVVTVPATGWSKTIEQTAGAGEGKMKAKTGEKDLEVTLVVSHHKVTFDPQDVVMVVGNGVRPYMDAPWTDNPTSEKGVNHGVNLNNLRTLKFQSTTGKETFVTIYLYKI